MRFNAKSNANEMAFDTPLEPSSATWLCNLATPKNPSPSAYTKLNLNSGSVGPGCWSGCWSWLLVLAAGLAGLVLAAGLAAGLALALALAAGPGCWSGWLLVASC